MNSSSPASNSFRLVVAGLDFLVQSQDHGLLAQLADRYVGFLGPADRPDGKPGQAGLRASFEVMSRSGGLNDLSGNISFREGLVRCDGPGVDGFIDVAGGLAKLCFSSQHVFELSDYFLRVALAVAVFRAGGLMLHAAGIVRQGRAYLFFGHSGSGKTTVARLSADCRVLNDDLVVLMPDQDSWQVHATPFWNPTQIRPEPGQAPLAGLFRLVQDQRVYTRPLQASQSSAELMANIPVLPADPSSSLELLDRVQILAQACPVVQLHFLPDSSFWQFIESAEQYSGNQL